MISGITGDIGSGKTLYLVQKTLAYYENYYKRYHKKPHIYSNFHFRLPDKGDSYTKKLPFDFGCYFMPTYLGTAKEFLDTLLSAREGLFVVDEAGFVFNSRRWAKLPYDVTASFQQSRKKDITIFYTTQRIGRVDLTLREITSRIIECKTYYLKEDLETGTQEHPLFLQTKIYNNKILDSTSQDVKKNSLLKSRTQFYNKLKPIMKLYDTKEFIDYSAFSKT